MKFSKIGCYWHFTRIPATFLKLKMWAISSGFRAWGITIHSPMLTHRTGTYFPQQNTANWRFRCASTLLKENWKSSACTENTSRNTVQKLVLAHLPISDSTPVCWSARKRHITIRTWITRENTVRTSGRKTKSLSGIWIKMESSNMTKLKIYLFCTKSQTKICILSFTGSTRRRKTTNTAVFLD